MGTHCKIFLMWELHSREINIGSDKGFMPSGNKPLPEPKLTQIYVAIWRHKAMSLVNHTSLIIQIQTSSWHAVELSGMDLLPDK